MPYLTGICDFELSKRQAAAKNDCQNGVLAESGIGYQAHQFVTDGAAISLLDNGVLDNGLQPVETEAGRYRLFLDGEIYNAHELAKKHGLDGDHTLTDAMICLMLFKRIGIDFLIALNGLFAIVIYDTEDRQLLIATDRFGFRPIFFRLNTRCLVFGSELKAASLFGNQYALDELGLLELFSFGQHIKDRTWLGGCKRLQPGAYLTFDECGLRIKRYWRYAYDESAKTLDQMSYFTIYRSLMDRATERCMKGGRRIGLFLSGGYDSRAIAASIFDHNKPMKAFTFGDPGSRDVIFASELANVLQLDHHTLIESEQKLADICVPVVLRTEGMLPFIDTTSTAFHSELRKHVEIILVGLLGEFGGSHTWPSLLISRTRSQVTTSMFSRLTAARAQFVHRYFKREFLDENLPILRENFECSFEEVANDHPLNVADSWNFMNFQPRGSFHAPSTDRHQFEVRAPHLDVDLVKFLLTIPPLSRIEQRVYKKMIAYGYPSIRSVPCTNSGKPINPN